MAKLRVGINGFGRIGRILFRAGFERLEIVGINDLSTPAEAAHLLKYDSTHGKFPGEVSAGEDFLNVNGKKISYSKVKDPSQIPWKKWEVDVVLECTGAFKGKEDFVKHIAGGAKKVLVSAPADGVDMTVVYGINHETYNPGSHVVLSNASCTTNCLAPVVRVLHDKFGIEHGLMTTIHSYTLDQRILDTGHKDLRRARAAALSMIPTTTGAAKAVGLVLPELKGKIDGTAIRVPTPNVSLVDFNFNAKKDLTKESINSVLEEASKTYLKGILAVEKAPLVSCDFNGNPHSSIVDLQSTMVTGSRMAKVFSWYDNEFGFSNRMVDMAIYMQEKGLK
ncbi:MAG: type I glyceraldehyde-3-phosphate dehydrogenase [Proteobacteria bacterium SG_bin7]|nr:MAG: type I glyceraldehyde-3-phosphate dehydrogenase [Proteobacteria bacterium SG_bin7]